MSSQTSRRTIAIELSTMRSGSTLLKALMSAAPDISSLPEHNFQKYQSDDAAQRIHQLCDERIIVLKKPAWFNEPKRYPLLPKVADAKRLILTRDVHTNVASLRKMAFRKAEPWIPRYFDNWLAAKYWAPVYSNLLDRFPEDSISNFWLRYEDLCKDPIRWTEKIFKFLGSERIEGTDSYPPPKNYQWKWGTDDGSENIKTLKVQPPKKSPETAGILSRVESLPCVARTRQALGYHR
ncbi:MAG: sulfotransferase [Verrucomicrobiota bacterium]